MRVWVRVHKFWFVCFLGGDVSRASSELSFECAEVRAADVDSLGGMLKPTVFRFNYVFAHRLPMKFFINFLISVLIKIFVFMFWFFLWIPLVIKEDDLYISGLQAAEMVGTFPMWGLRGLFLMYFALIFETFQRPPKQLVPVLTVSIRQGLVFTSHGVPGLLWRFQSKPLSTHHLSGKCQVTAHITTSYQIITSHPTSHHMSIRVCACTVRFGLHTFNLHGQTYCGCLCQRSCSTREDWSSSCTCFDTMMVMVRQRSVASFGFRAGKLLVPILEDGKISAGEDWCL